jgi:hypothetical protein
MRDEKKRGEIMNHREAIHSLLKLTAFELLAFIKKSENKYPDRWVPAATIKNDLDLNFVAVPRKSRQYGEKGWLFAILSRMLEDNDLVDYKKEGSRSFYRSKQT